MSDTQDIIDFSRKSAPSAEYHYDPRTLFARQSQAGVAGQALLILNSPIKSDDVLRRLWKASDYVVCADGGANCLYEALGQAGDDSHSMREIFLPNAIHGDLDSIQDSVRSYYSNLGIPITQDDNQYHTDFEKALNKIRDHHANYTTSADSTEYSVDVLIMGSLGGRVDQGLGLLSEILREQRAQDTDTRDGPYARNDTVQRIPLRLYLVSASSVSFLLAPGHNTIAFPIGSVRRSRSTAAPTNSTQNLAPASAPSEPIFTPNIGIIPIFNPAHITTRGLEYDVEDWPTQMGGQVSSSNHIVGEEVRVVTDEWVLFTVEMEEGFTGGDRGDG